MGMISPRLFLKFTRNQNCDDVMIKWNLDVTGRNLVKKAMRIGNFPATLANCTKDMLVFGVDFLDYIDVVMINIEQGGVSFRVLSFTHRTFCSWPWAVGLDVFYLGGPGWWDRKAHKENVPSATFGYLDALIHPLREFGGDASDVW